LAKGVRKKLSEQEVYEIVVELYSNEITMIEIGKDFGVSKALISKINRGEKYAIDGYHYPVRGNE
tara:strand:+ start:580 stop:774 length:195 start_codon:yes stop_codon:yes gene_type:complete